jgi:hypothetical protein
VTNNFATSLSAYTINSSTGALTKISGSPFAAGVYPGGIAVDPTGNSSMSQTITTPTYRLTRSTRPPVHSQL